jgi:hypothetical protein
MSDKKTYIVLTAANKRTKAKFVNRYPSGAAKKAAVRGVKNIRLLEVGTNKVHVYKGSVKKVKMSAGPSFLGSSAKVGKAMKIGIERLGK